MKKRATAWFLVVLMAALGFSAVPGMVESSIPSIYYVTPMVKTYENVVNCTGVVESEHIYQIYAPSNFVPGEVYVSLGDLVGTDQLLATVDRAATEKLPQNLIGGVAEEVASGLADAQSLDISSILSAYGLAGLLGGNLDLAGGLTVDTPSGTNAVQVPAEIDASDILSPADGVVTEVNIARGSPAGQGKLLFTVQDAENYLVMASVGEGDIAKVRVGDSAAIRGVGFGGASFQGTVTKIHPVARKALTGTAADTVVDVEIKVENPGDMLKAGFSAKVEIAGGQSQELITVPYEAIRQDENNEEYVYLYEEGKLKKTPIVTGREMVNEVEVLEGVSYDSIVIYNPDDVPGEGAIVNIKGRALVA